MFLRCIFFFYLNKRAQHQSSKSIFIKGELCHFTSSTINKQPFFNHCGRMPTSRVWQCSRNWELHPLKGYYEKNKKIYNLLPQYNSQFYFSRWKNYISKASEEKYLCPRHKHRITTFFHPIHRTCITLNPPYYMFSI